MSRLKAIAAGIAFVLALCVPAFAQNTGTIAPPPPGPGGPGGVWGHRGLGGPGMDGLFLKQLNLTDEQNAQISQIRSNHQTTVQNLMTQIRTQRQSLDQLMQGTTFDDNQAAQILSTIAPLEANLMGEHFRMHQEIEAVLTPDQKTKQAQLKAQFQQKMQQRMQRFRARRQQQQAPSSSL